MAQKLYIKTFGCQMNEYDSAKMADVLAAAEGMETTSPIRPRPTSIVFNTCSVREKAQEKVFHDLGRVKHLKRERPGLVIGVGGCVASQEGAAIVARAPYVDVVFGPQTLHRLPALIEARRRTGKPQVDISFPRSRNSTACRRRASKARRPFVSIMEGCSKYCSFCVVPYTRGEEVSRPFDDVLTEVAELALAGVKEVTLLGQNANAYRGETGGGSRGPRQRRLRAAARIRRRNSRHRAHPLHHLASQGIHPAPDRRLRPASPSWRATMHLPLQSGSDRVLVAMKRGYTALEYKSIIRRLRAARPDISISSDFIVGFPGETERDFEATMKLIAEIGFDDSFVSSTARGRARRRRNSPTTRRSR